MASKYTIWTVTYRGGEISRDVKVKRESKKKYDDAIDAFTKNQKVFEFSELWPDMFEVFDVDGVEVQSNEEANEMTEED